MFVRRVLTSSWPAVLAGAVAISSVLLQHDVPGESLARFAGYLLVGIAFPGVLAWRLLLQRLHVDEDPPTWFENLTLGTIFGFGLQLPFFLVGVATGVPLLLVVPPVVAAVVSVSPVGRRAWKLPTGRLDFRAAWALALVSAYGVFWLGRNAFPVRPLWLAPNQTPSIDETFHQALIADVGNRFPPQIPFLLDTRLDYHWFVHAQLAASHAATTLDSVLMLRFLLPTLALVGAVLGVAAVVLRLTRRPVAAVIAGGLMVVGAYHLLGPEHPSDDFLDPYLSIRFISSPSQAYGVMVSMPAVMLILEVLHPRRAAGRLTWLALILALLGLSGAKATFMPIFVCGAIGAWFIQLLVTRRIDRAATALVALLIAVAAFAQIVLFGGQTGAMAVSPFETVEVALDRSGLPLTDRNFQLMTLTLLTAWLLYGVGMVGLKKKLIDPRAVFLWVSIPAGITVPLVFFRTGLSQLWFSRSVTELLVIMSAWGLACLLPNPLTARKAVGLLGLVAAAGIGAFALSSYVAPAGQDTPATPDSMLLTVLAPWVLVAVWLVVRLVTHFLPGVPRAGLVLLLSAVLGLGTVTVVDNVYDAASGKPLVYYPAGGADGVGRILFAGGGVAAATYIRDNSPTGDIVATNVHCADPKVRRCDNRSFWVTAYTERRSVVEGWGYTAATNSGASDDVRNAYKPIPDPERLAINDAAFTDPSDESISRLRDTYGADWLFVSKKYEADLVGLRNSDLLEIRFRNQNYVVYKVLG